MTTDERRAWLQSYRDSIAESTEGNVDLSLIEFARWLADDEEHPDRDEAAKYLQDVGEGEG